MTCYDCGGAGNHSFTCGECDGATEVQVTVIVDGEEIIQSQTCGNCSGKGYHIEHCVGCDGQGYVLEYQSPESQ